MCGEYDDGQPRGTPSEDHLHMCGEYLSDSITTAELSGSPPHVWRIHALKDMSKEEIGITSTLVENTNRSGGEQFLWRDHLHTRGEYFTIDVVRPTNVGSPPHSWRILDLKVASHACTGITSTLVENTTASLISYGKR